MKLHIRKILIEKDGEITENLTFNHHLSVVCGSVELYDVIKLLLGKQEAAYGFHNVRFFAIVELDKTYYICGRKQKGNLLFDVVVWSEEALCTEDYFHAVRQNDEWDATLFFHRFKRQDYPHKLFKYRNQLIYYPDGEFDTLTNGYGTTRSFRGFITKYIRLFKPQKLRTDKDCYLTLTDDGQFLVQDENKNTKIQLSESEQVLYHYLSFVNIADFWDRAEKIRNIHRIKKPLIVSSFLERLDDHIDVTDILRKTNALDRQTILFMDKPTVKTNYTVRSVACGTTG